ncbi:MAG: hypothetical protein LUH05_01420 [Candidatus Gastranaerophilales bacterium]|nr:hypothetical protein [Candidatus Gastranaerophilales bacterium]
MTDKNIQLKDLDDNYLYPKTKSSIVLNNDGDSLGDVEAGAQVNKIEKITLNGVELSIVDKSVSITTDESDYSISKQDTAEDGYASTYCLTKDGTQVGEKINIPKDMVIQSGSIATCTAADSPVSGYVAGDKYIDFVIANSDNQHLYILVSDLVNTYTAGTNIDITNNTISVTGTVESSVKATQDGSGNVITSTYATKAEIPDVPANVSAFTNDAGYLTEHQSLDGYATETYVTNAISDLITYEELA